MDSFDAILLKTIIEVQQHKAEVEAKGEGQKGESLLPKGLPANSPLIPQGDG